MARFKHLGLTTTAAIAMAWATPALAVTSTQVVITQDQQEVPETRVQLFNAETGAEVMREDDDDERGALFLLDGGRYRVVVDGRTVQEIAVSGAGSELFDIGLPPSAAPGDLDLTDEQREAIRLTLQPPTAVDIFFGGGQADIPQTGAGFRRDGPPGSAPEEFAVTTPARVSTYSAEAAVRLRNVGIKARYSEGDGSSSFDIPGNAGVDSGVVYGDNAPSGSSGIATPFGLTGGAEVEQRAYGAQFDLGIYGGGAWNANWFVDPDATDGTDTRAGLSAYVAYDHRDLDVNGFADYTGSSGGTVFEFSQDRLQEVSETYYGAGLQGRVVTSFGAGVFGHLTGSAGVYYRDTELNSVEHNTSNFGPPADRDFTIGIDDSDDGFGFRGEAGAALELRLSPTLSIYAAGSADYWSDVGAIFNPNSGDQVFFDGLTTELRSGDAWSWRAGGGLIIRFGGQ